MIAMAEPLATTAVRYSVAECALGFVAIPYYLLRSRPRGQRFKAIVGLLAFFALLVVALFVGALPVELLS